jgi:transcriptional regulator with XRE-family HTH domain
MAGMIRHRQPVHNLYALRTAIHLPAEMVAGQVGVHVATYYRWEQGKSNPAREHRRALARVLRTTQAFLCQGD